MFMKVKNESDNEEYEDEEENEEEDVEDNDFVILDFVGRKGKCKDYFFVFNYILYQYLVCEKD